ncbi:MAG: hypothetical protein ABII88_09075 [Candidatus Omnitrophota bacterium]
MNKFNTVSRRLVFQVISVVLINAFLLLEFSWALDFRADKELEKNHLAPSIAINENSFKAVVFESALSRIVPESQTANKRNAGLVNRLSKDEIRRRIEELEQNLKKDKQIVKQEYSQLLQNKREELRRIRELSFKEILEKHKAKFQVDKFELKLLSSPWQLMRWGALNLKVVLISYPQALIEMGLRNVWFGLRWLFSGVQVLIEQKIQQVQERAQKKAEIKKGINSLADQTISRLMEKQREVEGILAKDKAGKRAAKQNLSGQIRSQINELKKSRDKALAEIERDTALRILGMPELGQDYADTRLKMLRKVLLLISDFGDFEARDQMDLRVKSVRSQGRETISGVFLRAYRDGLSGLSITDNDLEGLAEALKAEKEINRYIRKQNKKSQEKRPYLKFIPGVELNVSVNGQNIPVIVYLPKLKSFFMRRNKKVKAMIRQLTEKTEFSMDELAEFVKVMGGKIALLDTSESGVKTEEMLELLAKLAIEGKTALDAVIGIIYYDKTPMNMRKEKLADYLIWLSTHHPVYSARGLVLLPGSNTDNSSYDQANAVLADVPGLLGNLEGYPRVREFFREDIFKALKSNIRIAFRGRVAREYLKWQPQSVEELQLLYKGLNMEDMDLSSRENSSSSRGEKSLLALEASRDLRVLLGSWVVLSSAIGTQFPRLGLVMAGFLVGYSIFVAIVLKIMLKPGESLIGKVKELGKIAENNLQPYTDYNFFWGTAASGSVAAIILGKSVLLGIAMGAGVVFAGMIVFLIAPALIRLGKGILSFPSRIKDFALLPALPDLYRQMQNGIVKVDNSARPFWVPRKALLNMLKRKGYVFVQPTYFKGAIFAKETLARNILKQQLSEVVNRDKDNISVDQHLADAHQMLKLVGNNTIIVTLSSELGLNMDIEIPDPEFVQDAQLMEQIYRRFIAMAKARSLMLRDQASRAVFVSTKDKDGKRLSALSKIEQDVKDAIDNYLQEPNVKAQMSNKAGTRVEVLPENFVPRQGQSLLEYMQEQAKSFPAKKTNDSDKLVSLGVDVGGGTIRLFLLVDGEQKTQEIETKYQLPVSANTLGDKVDAANVGKAFFQSITGLVFPFAEAARQEYGSLDIIVYGSAGTFDPKEKKYTSMGTILGNSIDALEISAQAKEAILGEQLEQANKYVSASMERYAGTFIINLNDMPGHGQDAVARLQKLVEEEGLREEMKEVDYLVEIALGTGVGEVVMELHKDADGNIEYAFPLSTELGHDILDFGRNAVTDANSPKGSAEKLISVRAIIAEADKRGLLDKMVKDFGFASKEDIKVKHLGLLANSQDPLTEATLKPQEKGMLIRDALGVWGTVDARMAEHILKLYFDFGYTHFFFSGGTTSGKTGALRKKNLEDTLKSLERKHNLPEGTIRFFFGNTVADRGNARLGHELVAEFRKQADSHAAVPSGLVNAQGPDVSLQQDLVIQQQETVGSSI